jgi:hypothetical protein
MNVVDKRHDTGSAPASTDLLILKHDSSHGLSIYLQPTQAPCKTEAEVSKTTLIFVS